MASPPTPTVPLDEAQTPVDTDAGMPAGLTPGTRIGRYLVVEKIGEGGAGAVYAAFDAKLDRKVALKLLQAGGGGPLSTHDPRWPKLVGEARMLAKLSDPEVVTVFDVGEHDGVAYLAMELVSGGDLAAWIERHRGPDAPEPKPLREALALMLQAGEGLAHAHRAGLVHGDFKPGNVLIDVKGRAKVSDFGIARLRGAPPEVEQTAPGPAASHSSAPAQGRTEETGRGPRWIGTPAFMAPEQFDGVMPSEQTDVYAYATALFQAAYGVLPYSAKSMLEMATIKGHREPTRPASVKVPRWLDRVLDRGLSTDPAARYASMDALLSELRRGVRGRRTIGLALAGVLAVGTAAAGLALSAGGASQLCETDGFGWDASSADAVRSAFEELSAREAEQAFSRVDARMSGLQEAWAAAWAQACRAQDSPALQQHAMGCLQRQRRQADALVRAWTQGEGRGAPVVQRASRAAAALSDPDTCLDPDALARGERLPSDPELTEAVAAARAQIDAAVALSRAGRVSDALPKAQAAMEAAEETAFTPVIAEASLVLGRSLERSGDIEGAAAALERAYFEGVSAQAHARVAEAATRLVWIVGARLEKHDEGLLWAQHAEAGLEQAGGGRRDQLMTNVAGLLERKGEYAESLAMLQEALAATPAEASFDRGIVHQRIGDGLRRQGKADAAIEHYRQTIELWTEALGSAHPNVAIAKTSWASGLSRAGRPAEAEAAYREALTELEAAFGSEHPTLSATLQNLGIALKNQGKFDEAEPVLRRAVKIDAAVFGPDHLKTADRREALGRLLTRRGKGAQALAEHEAAGKIYAKSLEPGHPWLILNRMNRGDALRQSAAAEQAKDAYRAGYEAAQASLDADDPLLHDAAAYYGRALVETGHYDRAVAVLGPALRALREAEGYEDAVALAGWALARAQVQTGGDVAEAVELAKASREGLAAWPEEQAALGAWVAAHE